MCHYDVDNGIVLGRERLRWRSQILDFCAQTVSLRYSKNGILRKTRLLDYAEARLEMCGLDWRTDMSAHKKLRADPGDQPPI
jgi:hypothetical protein